jgi:molybdopterin molybdotransferase
MGIAPDEPSRLLHMIAEAMEHHEVVLLTGGVSMGDYDFVPSMLKKAGLEIYFEKIAVQPGKPTVFAGKAEKFVFGLPGNPVSSFVLFELLVKPFLYKLMNHFEPSLNIEVQMGVPWSRKKTDRKAFVPVRLAGGKAFPVTYHGSAHINAYTGAEAILGVEIGQREIAAGELVYVRLL